MSQLKLCLLGPLRIEIDGQSVTINRRKAAALLAYLAVTQQPHSREALTALFWSDTDQSRAYTYLRILLLTLNKTLGRHWFDIDRDLIRIDPDANLWLDVDHFRRLATTPDGVDHFTALADAVELYSDDFMAGFTLPDSPAFDEWQYFQRDTLRGELARILQELARYHAAQGQTDSAVSYAKRWLALDTLHEPAHRELMRLYYEAGQRSAALRQYKRCAALLDAELGVEPEAETMALYELIRDHPKPEHPAPRQASSPITVAPPRGSIPSPVTLFVGREHELSEITHLLTDPTCHLLTLVGAGGVGKTRLALQAANQLMPSYPQGACFVPLEAVSSVDFLVPAIVDTIGLQGSRETNLRAQLFSWLEGKRLLLVLDNFEHLLDGANIISDILHAAPGIKILTTSREKLNLSEETVYRIDGLDFPEDGTSDELLKYSAVRLFVQNARQAQPDFKLTPENLHHIASICQLVQGMPLAVVLAAAWVGMLPLREIVQEIGQNLDFLQAGLRDIPQRHRSMRDVFDYSWKLMNEHERDAFVRLAIFRGGFTRHAALQVAGASLHGLAALVNKSLVRPDVTMGRYDVHELLRQYAEEKLTALGLFEGTRTAHSIYYADFMHDRLSDLKGHRQLDVLHEIEVDFENIKAAWAWAADRRDYDTLNQMIESLYVYCVMRGLWMEAEIIFNQARRRLAPLPGEEPHPVWARLLTYFYGDTANTRAQIQQALEIARAHHDRSQIAHCLAELGWLAMNDNDYGKARRFFESSLGLYRDLGDGYYTTMMLRGLALCASSQGNNTLALALNEQSLELNRQIGNWIGAADNLSTSGSLMVCAGDYAGATRCLTEAYTLQHQIKSPLNMVISGLALSWLYLLQGSLAESRELITEVLHIASDINNRQGKSAALLLLALLASLEGNPARSRQIYEESLSGASDLENWASVMNPDLTLLQLWGKAVVACDQGDYLSARQDLVKVFNNGMARYTPSLDPLFLPIAALVLAQEGKKKEALNLLALEGAQPAIATGWLKKWPLVARCRTELEAELGRDMTLQGSDLALASDIVAGFLLDKKAG